MNQLSDYTHKNDWYYEGNISNAIVRYLKSLDYKIIQNNSDNPNARGVDIIAISGKGKKELIEVKGYPTLYYVNGPNKGKAKKAKPQQQATHWFAGVLLTTLFNYEMHHDNPDCVYCIGLPYYDKYLELISAVEPFFKNFKIILKVYFVGSDGTVAPLYLGKDKYSTQLT